MKLVSLLRRCCFIHSPFHSRLCVYECSSGFNGFASRVRASSSWGLNLVWPRDVVHFLPGLPLSMPYEDSDEENDKKISCREGPYDRCQVTEFMRSRCELAFANVEIFRTDCERRITPTGIKCAQFIRELLVCFVSSVFGFEFFIDWDDTGIKHPIDDGREKPTSDGE